MKIFLVAAICALLVSCSHSSEKIKQPVSQSAERSATITDNWSYGTARSEKGPTCTTVNATTKKCFLPKLQLVSDSSLPPDSRWTTVIGEGDSHYIIIEQQAEHRVVAEWKYNIYTDKPVRAAFDPDLWVSYNFFNKEGVKIGNFVFGAWRNCPPTTEHQKNQVIPGNLDFVADTYNVELAVEYRLVVKPCTIKYKP